MADDSLRQTQWQIGQLQECVSIMCSLFESVLTTLEAGPFDSSPKSHSSRRGSISDKTPRERLRDLRAKILIMVEPFAPKTPVESPKPVASARVADAPSRPVAPPKPSLPSAALAALVRASSMASSTDSLGSTNGASAADTPVLPLHSASNPQFSRTRDRSQTHHWNGRPHDSARESLASLVDANANAAAEPKRTPPQAPPKPSMLRAQSICLSRGARLQSPPSSSATMPLTSSAQSPDADTALVVENSTVESNIQSTQEDHISGSSSHAEQQRVRSQSAVFSRDLTDIGGEKDGHGDEDEPPNKPPPPAPEEETEEAKSSLVGELDPPQLPPTPPPTDDPRTVPDVPITPEPPVGVEKTDPPKVIHKPVSTDRSSGFRVAPVTASSSQASSHAGSHGACDCGCDSFKAHAFKAGVCSMCFHKH